MGQNLPFTFSPLPRPTQSRQVQNDRAPVAHPPRPTAPPGIARSTVVCCPFSPRLCTLRENSNVNRLIQDSGRRRAWPRANTHFPPQIVERHAGRTTFIHGFHRADSPSPSFGTCRRSSARCLRSLRSLLPSGFRRPPPARHSGSVCRPLPSSSTSRLSARLGKPRSSSDRQSEIPIFAPIRLLVGGRFARRGQSFRRRRILTGS